MRNFLPHPQVADGGQRKGSHVLKRSAFARTIVVPVMMSCLLFVNGYGQINSDRIVAANYPTPKKSFDNRKPLTTVLAHLESQFGVNFSYDVKVVAEKSVGNYNIYPNEIGKTLDNLLTPLALRHTEIDAKYYVIVPAEGEVSGEIEGQTHTLQDVSQNDAIDITVQGTVRSAGGNEPLPGVNVVIKGTTQGTVTDVDGKYSIAVPDGGAVLVFSFIGFAKQEVAVNGRTTIDVSLDEDVQSLKEVVVIGYGTVKREELTSSVVSVNQKDFISGAVNDPIQMIDGKVAGLTMGTPAAADPNAGSSLQIRGVASINAGTGPLVVVDGVPGRSLNTISKDEIESITVLKDGASSAIYGARGANGVILVTTKKSKGGSSTFSYEGHVSTNVVAKQPEILSAREYVAYGRSNTYDPSQADNLPYSSNFYDELINRSSIENYHNMALSGGSDQSNYRLSINYRDTDGVDISSHREQYGARLNFNHSIREKVDIFGNIYVNKSSRQLTDYLAFRQAIKAQPTEPIFDPADPSKYYLFSGFDYYNPVALLKNNTNKGENTAFSGDVNFQWHILDNLTTSLLLAENASDDATYFYSSSESRESRDNQYDGRATRGYGKSRNQILEWTTNYYLEKEQHNLQLLAGYSFQNFADESFSAWNANFPSDGLLWNNLAGGTWHSSSGGQVAPSSSKSSSKLIAFFGRANYSFDGTYLLSASLRREGSSKFGANNKWGMFPGISAGWIVSKMDFFDNVDFISNLKVRAGYGVTGRENISSLLSVPTYRTHSYYNLEGTWLQSWGPASNPNPDLKWEVGINTNIGLDVTAFEDRLSVSLDWYNRETKDLLFYTPTPKPPYIYGSTWSNVGSIENKGIEAVIDWTVIKNASFEFNTSIVGSYGKSKMLQIRDNALESGSTFIDYYTLPAPGNPGTIVRLEEGKEIGNFFMYEHAGIDEDGNFLIYNRNNEVINATQKSVADKRYVGNGMPDVTMSWTNTFRYKNFDLSLFFKGAFGWDVVNLHQMYYGLSNAPGNVLKDAYGKNANIKAEKETSSYFMEKGDYLNLRNVALGYTFPLSGKSLFKSCRAYLNATNLFTITEFSGLDPTQLEVNGLTPGIQSMNFYPSTRSFTAAVQLSF